MPQTTNSSSSDVVGGVIAACTFPGVGQKGIPPADVPYGFTYLQGLGDGSSTGTIAGIMQGYAIGVEVGHSDSDDDAYGQGILASFVVGYQVGDIKYAQGYSDGSVDGRISGQTQGYAIGRALGNAESEDDAYSQGLNDSFQTAYQIGDIKYAQGYADGADAGQISGQTKGYATGCYIGRADAEDDAYSQGLNDSFPIGFQAGQASVVIGGSDVTAPTITIVYPPAGATIGQSTVIVFRYADETGLRRPLPCARFLQPDGSYRYELIHDGDNFTPDYQGTRSVISSSPAIIEYAVTRRGGWGATLSYHGGSPTLVPFGTDTSGNEPA